MSSSLSCSSVANRWATPPSSSVLPSPTVAQSASSSFQPFTDSKKTLMVISVVLNLGHYCIAYCYVSSDEMKTAALLIGFGFVGIASLRAYSSDFHT